MSMKDLKEKRARTIAAMRALTAAPAGDGGDLSADQSTQFETHKAELTALEARIGRQEFVDDAERRMAARPLEGGGRDDFETACRAFSLVRAIRAAVPDLADGVDAGREREVSAELIRRSGRSAEGFMAPLIAFLPERRAEQRVLTIAGDAGNLKQTTVLADQFVDALRPASVATRLARSRRMIIHSTRSRARRSIWACSPSCRARRCARPRRRSRRSSAPTSWRSSGPASTWRC
jgi:hypothetical protein